MPLRLSNTRTHSTGEFTPLDGREVRMYVCGLTPSAQPHLGHARTYVFFDVLRRYLVHRGYRVRHVQNVTDVDDRSIAAARTSGRPLAEVVAEHEAAFKRGMNRLHVLEPDLEPHATAYIPAMTAMIGELVAREHAYVVGDGVYFAVASFPRYGALSGRRTDELLIGARIAPGEEKRDPLDFALWKFAREGEPSWASPWGPGRPGWHIECSAMAHELLGEPFDIHGGGDDLIFPHHENEIAQTESLLGRPPMANFWVHGGLLNFDGKKMSKSLGNFEPLEAVLARHDPQAIRLFFLETGYRKRKNYTEEALAGATAGLRKLQAGYDALRRARDGSPGEAAQALVEGFRARFEAALDDDLNTSGALSVLFDLVARSGEVAHSAAAAPAAAFLHEAMALLGISPSERAERAEAALVAAAHGRNGARQIVRPSDAAARLPADLAERLRALRDELDLRELHDPGALVDAIVGARLDAKAAREFARADRLRAALADVGVSLADSKDGTAWRIDR